jgi:PIN domain nuclease of toxin-antitoxin system
MGFSVRKRHQDVKHCGREWQKIFSHDVSSSDITSLDIVISAARDVNKKISHKKAQNSQQGVSLCDSCAFLCGRSFF